jgi:hypothetical protein
VGCFLKIYRVLPYLHKNFRRQGVVQYRIAVGERVFLQILPAFLKPALGTSPIFPGFGDGKIKATAIVRAENVTLPFFMGRSWEPTGTTLEIRYFRFSFSTHFAPPLFQVEN